MAMPAQAAGPEENLATTSHDWTKFAYDLANTSYTPDPGPRVLSVRWRFPSEPYRLPTEIWSWPAVVENVVYVAATYHIVVTDDPWIRPYRNFENSVFALNAENGDVIWRRQLGTFEHSSPTVVDGVLYLASDQGNVYALNKDNGDTIWEQDLIANQDNWVYNISSPTVVDGKVLIVTQEGYVYALDKENGDITWGRKVDNYIGTSLAVADGKVYTTPARSITALDVENGEILWVYSIENENIYWEFGTSPTVAYGKVFAVTNGGWVYSVYAESGGLVWKYKMGGWPLYYAYAFGAPATAHGMIYTFKSALFENAPIGQDTLLAINADNGSVVWEGPPNDLGLRAIVADNVVFAGWHGGELWMLNASTGELLQKMDTGGGPDGLSVVGDKIYVTFHGGFVACLGMPDTGAWIEPPQTSPVLWLAIFGVAGAVVIGFLFLMFRTRLLTARGIRRR
jgi:outer membrane protein assembly factor BamB